MNSNPNPFPWGMGWRAFFLGCSLSDRVKFEDTMEVRSNFTSMEEVHKEADAVVKKATTKELKMIPDPTKGTMSVRLTPVTIDRGTSGPSTWSTSVLTITMMRRTGQQGLWWIRRRMKTRCRWCLERRWQVVQDPSFLMVTMRKKRRSLRPIAARCDSRVAAARQIACIPIPTPDAIDKLAINSKFRWC